jgi:hypothetical protein
VVKPIVNKGVQFQNNEEAKEEAEVDSDFPMNDILDSLVQEKTKEVGC